MNGLLRGAVIGALIAVVLNVVIYLLTSSQGVILNVTGNPFFDVVPLYAVIGATILSAFAAALVLWLLHRVSERPLDLFLLIAFVIGLVSLIGPYAGTETRGALIGLGLMHVAATLGIVWGLLYSYDNNAA